MAFVLGGFLLFLMFTTVDTYFTGRVLGRINEDTSQYIKDQKANLSRYERRVY